MWEHSCPHLYSVGALCIGATENPPSSSSSRGRSSLNTSRTSALVTSWVLFISHQRTTLFWRFVLDERRTSSSPIVEFPWFCLVFPVFSPVFSPFPVLPVFSPALPCPLHEHPGSQRRAVLYQHLWAAQGALLLLAASQGKIWKLDPSPRDFDFLICFLLDLALFWNNLSSEKPFQNRTGRFSFFWKHWNKMFWFCQIFCLFVLF